MIIIIYFSHICIFRRPRKLRNGDMTKWRLTSISCYLIAEHSGGGTHGGERRTFCRPWRSTQRWGKYPKWSRVMLLQDAGMYCLFDTAAVMRRSNRTKRLIGCLTPICCLSLHRVAASQGNFSSCSCIWKCSPWSPQNPDSAYSHMSSPNFKEDDDARDAFGVARMFCQCFCAAAFWMRMAAPEQKPIIWHDFDFKKIYFYYFIVEAETFWRVNTKGFCHRSIIGRKWHDNSW